MSKNNRNLIISFLTLYIISALISMFQTLTQNNYPGELEEFTRSISSFEVVSISFFNIMSFVACYFIFSMLSSFRVKINKNLGVVFVKERINKLLLILLVAQILFLLITSVGKVTTNVNEISASPYSPLFAFLKPEPFIYLFFLTFRMEKDFSYRKNLLFTINILLFITFKILQGWTSFLLIMFFLEAYARFQRNKSKFVFLLPLFIIFFGGWIYQYAYVIKNEIRGSTVAPISYFQGVEQLTSRLSMNPVSLGAYQNYDSIIKLYQKENITFKESASLLRPIIPGGLIDKDYRILNNNVIASFYPDLNQYTSSDFGIVMYYYILFNSSFPDFILLIFITITLLIIAKMYFDSMSSYSGQYDILLFFILFYTIYTVSIENVYGQGFFPYIFSTVFFYFSGGIKFIIRK
ncbi:oligosaccharide repeat unit polymerase [Citrobacter sp. Cpo089]|nr:oligosaccharide repeat unit polymerase [Citrobacter sp. Cpo089]MDM2827709.1 oligosaccharide repeat unit polymerase [Citrobacter sp. Cpo089]